MSGLIALMDERGRRNPEGNSYMLWEREWNKLRARIAELERDAEANRDAVVAALGSTDRIAELESRLERAVEHCEKVDDSLRGPDECDLALKVISLLGGE